MTPEISNNIMISENILLDLLKQRSVNHLVKLFATLTENINKSLIKKPNTKVITKEEASTSEESGASEISEFLGGIVYPLSIKMSDKDLYEYLIRSHIAFLYFSHSADLAFDDLQLAIESLKKKGEDIFNNPQYIKLDEIWRKNSECSAVVANMRSIWVDITLKRRYGNTESYGLQQLNETLKPIEKEYDDFAFLLSNSTFKNIRKICSLEIKDVADTSRCITLTEMVSIKGLATALNKFYSDRKERNKFQCYLCRYMIQNLDSIIKAQNDLAEKSESQKPSKQLLEILTNIKDVIINTKWTVGWLGGVSTYDTDGRLLYTIPHGMSKMLAEINSVLEDCKKDTINQPKRIFEGFAKIAKQAAESAQEKPFSLFCIGKRDLKTQNHYDDLNQFVKPESRMI